jgi:hypothetical protein
MIVKKIYKKVRARIKILSTCKKLAKRLDSNIRITVITEATRSAIPNPFFIRSERLTLS